MKKVRWGILGTGKIAAKFADEIGTLDECEIVAVASSSGKDKAEKFGLEYNIPHCFGSYQEMLQSDKLDVIYVATPHAFHHECVIECLQHGKAVLCEKPFAMNQQQVSEMVELANKSNLFLMEAMWTAFMPTIQKTKELISNGAIGEIKSLQADFGFLSNYDAESRIWKKSLGGGAMLDIGIYPIFLSLFLLGYPEMIHSTSRFNQDGVDISSTMIFEYGNDAIASLSCHLDVDTPTQALICGTKGYLRIMPRFHESQEIRIGNVMNENEEIIRFDRTFRGFTYQVQEVNECLRNGKTQSTIMSHDMSLNLIKLLDACREKSGLHY